MLFVLPLSFCVFPTPLLFRQLSLLAYPFPTSILCIYIFIFFRVSIQEKTCSVCLSVRLILLHSLIIPFDPFSCKEHSHSFSLVYISFIFFTHLSVNASLLAHILAVVDSARMNMDGQISL